MDKYNQIKIVFVKKNTKNTFMSKQLAREVQNRLLHVSLKARNPIIIPFHTLKLFVDAEVIWC